MKLLAPLGLLAWLASSSVAAEPVGFDDAVGPFLQKYCLRCHSDRKQEGEFRLDTLSRDFADATAAERWEEVLFRMNAGEMPPRDESQPTPPDELGKVVDWLSARSREGEAARMARRGPVAHYRLSRNEYQNTIYVLGVYYDVNRPGIFNQDPLWHGFDHIGSMLSLSPSHVEHYYKAAEEILEVASLNRPVKSKKAHKKVADVHQFDDGEL